MMELVHQLFNKFRLFYRENWLRGIEPEDYEELVDMWCQSLSGCTEYQIQQACNRIVTGLSSHNTYSPSPGEFVELARSIRHPDRPSTDPGFRYIPKTVQSVSSAVSNLFIMRDIFLAEYEKRGSPSYSFKKKLMGIGSRSEEDLRKLTQEKENG